MHDDDPYLEEREEEQTPWWKKLYIGIIGLLLLGLMLSYFIFAPVADTIRGQISSETVRDNQLVFGDVMLDFRGATDRYLAQLYTENQEVRAVETSACLKGNKQGNTYVITEVFEPRIIQQAYNHVTFTACPQDTLVMLHTHPYLRCEASHTDEDTFRGRKEQNPDLLMVIMCAPDRYVVYR